MSEFKHISVQEVADNASAYTIVDIRDPQSFANGHMNDAMHLSNQNLAEFIARAPKAQPVVVVCYHGISSQQAAQMISGQGFEDVYSMDGGFEAWRSSQSVVTSAS